MSVLHLMVVTYSMFFMQLEAPAPASLSPLAELSLAPPADSPEAVFDLMATANLQPLATVELNSTPEPEAVETEDASDLEQDSNINQALSEEAIEKEEEEIPLNEVLINHCHR